mmetsp:Transcript_29609/g.87785  ORF Transcript_29609/g.87785 Transcript_29609/m.87785 type:complete len:237 (-) Transcript_29609:60-770(-)
MATTTTTTTPLLLPTSATFAREPPSSPRITTNSPSIPWRSPNGSAAPRTVRSAARSRSSSTGGTARKCSGCGAVSWPRQDPSMIVVISNRADTRVLLGRSRRHAPRMHTALAGFVEAGETFERAVAREAYEETGVRVDVDSVSYVGSQPWPFPQSAMIGFMARADDRQELNIDTNELVEAAWFDREQVRRAAEVRGPLMRRDVAERVLRDDPSLELLIPPRGVIARTLIEAWLERQ